MSWFEISNAKVAIIYQPTSIIAKWCATLLVLYNAQDISQLEKHQCHY